MRRTAIVTDPWAELRAHWAKCAKEQPDFTLEEERGFLDQVRKAYEDLRQMGWQEIEYCPKDGTTFLAICAGWSRVVPCLYRGDWPTGSWWALDSGDMWPVYPMLWKPMSSVMKGQS